MKKKWLYVLSIVCMLALSLCLIACDSSSGGSDGNGGGDSPYKIYFDVNGGEFDSDPYVMTGTDGKIKKSDFPDDPTRKEYIFDGWYTSAVGGEVVNADYVFYKNSTVYAHWTEDGKAPPTGGDHTCTYEKGDKGNDGTSHWYLCDICGKAGEPEQHDYGSGYACTVCGYHSHTYDRNVEDFMYLKSPETTCDRGAEYYKSCVCGAASPTATFFAKGVHSMDYNAAVTANCFHAGNIEYWECKSCGKYFSDNEAENEITDKSSVVIPQRRNHEFTDTVGIGANVYDVCAYCGSEKERQVRYEISTVMDYDSGANTYRLDLMEGDDVRGAVELPCSYNGQPITSVCGSRTFDYVPLCIFGDGSDLVTELTVPNGYGHIGENAFYGCVALRRVVVADSVTVVEYGAFGECPIETARVTGAACGEIAHVTPSSSAGNSALTSVVVTGGKVYDEAFKDCDNLASVTIESGVKDIGKNVFDGCTLLQYYEVGGVKYLGNSGNQRLALISVPHNSQSFTVDGNTKIIAGGAFNYCRNLTDLIIPDTVKGIGSAAFSNSGITTITLPNGMTSIAAELFDGNHSLTEIAIPNTVVNIGYKAFNECYGLSSVSMPTSLVKIEREAFWNCENLTNVELPDGLKEIGIGAFGFCAKLTDIEIPDSVVSFGEGAFTGCERLSSVTVGNGVECIDDQFRGCADLTSLAIGSGVIEIAPNAFEFAGDLTSITVASGNSAYIGVGNCLIEKASKTIIRACANSVIPSDGSVVSIGTSAFEYCGMTDITIPDSIKEIADGAFAYCRSLESVSVSRSVTSIGDYAFVDCNNLSSITVESGNTAYSSQDGILYNKAKTEILLLPKKLGGAITIPSGVTNIPSEMFSGLDELSSITVESGNTAYSSQSGILYNRAKTEMIHAPRKISGAITIPSGVTNIRGIYSYADVTEVTVESGNARYSSDGKCLVDKETGTLLRAYSGCVIPDDGSVTVIGNSAFGKCIITDIVLPYGVTTIEMNAFERHWNLNIEMPVTITEIKNMSFFDCDNLNVTYKGTRAQWNGITKGENWSMSSQNVTVHCTDD